LDRDIFTINLVEIKNIKVEKTMIYGEFVYEQSYKNQKFIIVNIKICLYISIIYRHIILKHLNYM